MREILLTWPLRELSPNARVHWAARSRAAKRYRHTCWALAMKACLKVDWDGPVHLWLTFLPPDRRHRDDDNMIASFKSGRDGLADALGIDDKRFRVHPVVSVQTAPGGAVAVRITQNNNEGEV